MPTNRRDFLISGAAAMGTIGTATMMPFVARAGGHGGDVYKTANGAITIHPINHASFVMETPNGVIYVDPVGDAKLYEAMPDPDHILITHHHGDHYQEETLTALPSAPLLVNQEVMGMLSAGLKANATAISNGETGSMGEIGVEAIPAYNLTEDRLKYHPPTGRDNGYVLSVDGMRVYVSGDTEDIPEMRALKDIDLAFVCMNLPYTMEVEKAADAVKAFAPSVVYPYHYGESDTAAFAELVGGVSDVKLADWYAKSSS